METRPFHLQLLRRRHPLTSPFNCFPNSSALLQPRAQGFLFFFEHFMFPYASSIPIASINMCLHLEPQMWCPDQVLPPRRTKDNNNTPTKQQTKAHTEGAGW